MPHHGAAKQCVLLADAPIERVKYTATYCSVGDPSGSTTCAGQDFLPVAAQCQHHAPKAFRATPYQVPEIWDYGQGYAT